MAKPQKAKSVSPEGDASGNQEQYQALRERLTQQRQEILDLYNQDVRAGQESADDPTEDIVDRANNAYNRELMFSLSDGERILLLQIEDAIRRMDEGTYGRCVNCNQSIAMPRLEAIPWARYCIDCQELSEKGMLNDD